MSKKVIVVGIDGSDASADALRWACGQARLTGSSLHVVYAWDPPTVVSMGLPPLVGDFDALYERALDLPHDFARAVLGDVDVTIVPITERGHAAQVLVDASADAELLVIGSRGLGGLRGMVLGSVGHHCAAHSHCPVVIVHGEPVVAKKRPVRREGLHQAG